MHPVLREPKSQTTARSAPIQPQHEAELFVGAAVIVRIDTERAMLPVQQRRTLFQEFEPRIPHQGAVGEHPDIAIDGVQQRSLRRYIAHQLLFR